MRLKNEEGIGYHKFEGIENDERQSGTICSTNSGKGGATSGPSSEIDYISTIDGISIGKTIEGAKA